MPLMMLKPLTFHYLIIWWLNRNPRVNCDDLPTLDLSKFTSTGDAYYKAKSAAKAASSSGAASGAAAASSAGAAGGAAAGAAAASS